MNPRRLELIVAVVALGCSAPPPPPPPPQAPPPPPVVLEPGCVPEDIFAPLPAEAVEDIYQSPPSATATSPYDPDDPVVAARLSYAAGRKADAEKRWEAAWSAFREGWSHFKNPHIAFGLAKTAMSLGRPSEALYYIAFVLRSPGFPEDQRAEANRWKTKAEGEISWLDVHAEPGSCVTLGGLTVGLTPLGSPVVVDPGKYRVEVRHQGKRKSEEVTTTKGAVARVTLKPE